MFEIFISRNVIQPCGYRQALRYHSRTLFQTIEWLKKITSFLHIYFGFCNDNWFLVDWMNLMALFHQSYFDCTRFICSNCTITSQIFVTAAQSQCTETGYPRTTLDATRHDMTRRCEIYAQAHLQCETTLNRQAFLDLKQT